MLESLIEVSRRYGSDSAFVLAGGGNTSWKQGNRLWVKASGHALATIDADGFVELDRLALERMLHDSWPADAAAREALFVERVMAARVHPARNQRPSVEALLHHLLPEPLVVHTHPGAINALTCCIDGPILASQMLGDKVLWQPYVDPGLTLAQALAARIEGYRKRQTTGPNAILLANHGFIVSGSSPEEIDATTRQIVGRIGQSIAARGEDDVPSKLDQGLIEKYQEVLMQIAPGHVGLTDCSESIRWLVATARGKQAALAGPLTPDQIVYCRSFPLWIDAADVRDRAIRQAIEAAIEEYERTHGAMPWVFLISGGGMIAMRAAAKLAHITRDLYVDAAAVYRRADELGGALPLSATDRQFIENWEVEAYRRSVAAR